jgi:preprotein translocase subunit SecA
LEKRRGEYEKDITYVENSELGFDYLRDNLVQSMEQRMLLFRPLNYAIVDEADSILIDEARTPLIISQPSGEPTEKYKFYAEIVKALVPCPEQTKKKKSWLFEEEKEPEPDCDYKIDHKAKTALLTSKGIAKLEKIL